MSEEKGLELLGILRRKQLPHTEGNIEIKSSESHSRNPISKGQDRNVELFKIATQKSSEAHSRKPTSKGKSSMDTHPRKQT